MDGISINKQDFYNQKGIIFPKFEQEFAWPYHTNFRRVPVDVEIPWTPQYFIKAQGAVRSQNQFSMATLAATYLHTFTQNNLFPMHSHWTQVKKGFICSVKVTTYF